MKKAELEKRITQVENEQRANGLTLMSRIVVLEKRLEKHVKTSLSDPEEIKRGSVEWIPMSGKRRPKKGAPCLILTSDDSMYAAVWDDVEFKPNGESFVAYWSVTHWAELPAVPWETEKQPA